MDNVGYLQHGVKSGPFATEAVTIRHLFADNWQAYYDGQWRKVHIQVKRTYIVHNGERITIKIEGA
jgi:Rps23 Pro-64 3,4-dihydroxylase Tpa1-like proline 4-hydroxylase